VTEDLFGRPAGSNYPKPEDLEGLLLLLKASGPIESIAQKPEYGGGMRDRARADTAVFGPDGVEEYSDMFWSQTVVVNALKQSMKEGAKPYVAGHLVKVATKASREALKIGETPEDFATAREAWLKKGGKGTEPKHVWIFSDFTDDEAQRIREYIASKTKKADPFAAAAAE
jgi:hypothetical protein